jgi:hypothetical protein
MSPSSTSTDPFEGGGPAASPPPAPGKEKESRKPFSLNWGVGYYTLVLVLLIGAAFLPRCGWLCASREVSCVQEQPIRRPAQQTQGDGGTESPDAGVASPENRQTLPEGRETVNPVHACLSDCALVYYVILLGMLGGWLHGVSSLATFAGMKRLDGSWWTFYLARPLVGGGTALLVYFILQSGLAGFYIPTDLWRGQMALLAWAGIAGLSSTVAMRKMRDVLDALFSANNQTDTRQQKPRQNEQAETGQPQSVVGVQQPETASLPTTLVTTKPDVQTPTVSLAPKPPSKPSAGGE